MTGLNVSLSRDLFIGMMRLIMKCRIPCISFMCDDEKQAGKQRRTGSLSSGLMILLPKCRTIP